MKLLIQLDDGTTVKTIYNLEAYDLYNPYAQAVMGIIDLLQQVGSGIEHGNRMQAEFEAAERGE
jgi:hypothetical protein